jgi:hypothetical protein
MEGARMERFAAHIDANRPRYMDELRALLRQPSIAAQGVGLEETAALVSERLRALGAEVQVLRLPGAAPVVYGSIGQGQRTLLIYDHYDVQPPEPLDLWKSPPLSPRHHLLQANLHIRPLWPDDAVNHDRDIEKMGAANHRLRVSATIHDPPHKKRDVLQREWVKAHMPAFQHQRLQIHTTPTLFR